jgi:hypothetical protein
VKIDSFNIQFADNGVILEFNGRDSENDWCSRKEVFPSFVVAIERAQQVFEARHDGSIFQDCDKD